MTEVCHLLAVAYGTRGFLYGLSRERDPSLYLRLEITLAILFTFPWPELATWHHLTVREAGSVSEQMEHLVSATDCATNINMMHQVLYMCMWFL